MLEVSLLVGILSVLTSYIWWTQDWWIPKTITNTRIGFEDFLIGFFAGGVMSSGYEIVLKLRDSTDAKFSAIGKIHAYITLFLLSIICSTLYWGLGLPSAFACFVSLLVAAVYIVAVRPDLWKVSIGSGLVMIFAAVPFYVSLVIFFPTWIEVTYPFEVLTGVRMYNVPIEEFIFWFLSGLVFGPFYEVLRGFRELKMKSISHT
jgi:hypothetical protein